jgi:hypothetical protein
MARQRSEGQKFWRGDPEDHEIVHAVGDLYQPMTRLGCMMWLASAGVFEAGGLFVATKIDPEFFSKLVATKPEAIVGMGLLTLGAIAIGPVMSYLPILHIDMEHYDRTTEHVHLPGVAKFVVNSMLYFAYKIGHRSGPEE